MFKQIKSVHITLFENYNDDNNSVLIMTAFENEKECETREYLLKPHKRINIIK